MLTEQKLRDQIEAYKQLLTALGALQNTAISSGEFLWSLQTALTIFDRCPFKVGDRVQLTKTPVINEAESWGWMGFKHFLVEGALATVQARSFYKGKFRFDLCFDDESIIDSYTKEVVKSNKKGVFVFYEDDLKAAPV